MKILKQLLEVISVISIATSIGVIIAVFVYLQNIEAKHSQVVAQLQSEINQQKNDKDQISYLWEEQAAQNDNLIREQTEYKQEVQILLNELDSTFRFVKGEAQIKSTANEISYNEKLNAVNAQGQQVEDQTVLSVDSKDEAKAIIDQLYLERGEDLKNRANPREGIRTE